MAGAAWAWDVLHVTCPAAGPLQGVVQVSCGEAHSGVLLRVGAAAFAGCNTRGACGLGEEMGSAPVFCEAALPAGAAACRLSCGGHNSALVTAGEGARRVRVRQ